MSQMRPNASVYGMYIPHQAHKKKKRKGPFKMMATPTLRRFKMIWGPTPQAHILINACSLYAVLCAIMAHQYNNTACKHMHNMPTSMSYISATHIKRVRLTFFSPT